MLEIVLATYVTKVKCKMDTSAKILGSGPDFTIGKDLCERHTYFPIPFGRTL